jgi:hypothetical protein
MSVLRWLDDSLSRRGFLARLGTALVGIVAAGLSGAPLASGAGCCPADSCPSCPDGPGCPSSCTRSDFYYCCIGTRLWGCWRCACGSHTCRCSAVVGTCLS